MVVYLWACFFSRASFCVHGISLHETKKTSLHNKYHKLLLPAVLSFFLLPPPPPNLKMSQCVPSWDIDETPLADRIALHPNLNTHELITSQANPMLDDGVAELTWENGHLAMHGLRPPRVAAKGKQTTTKYSWDKPRASGTLESIVNQATQFTPPSKSSPFRRGGDDGLISWFDSHRNHHCATVPTTSNTMSMDGLVPRSSNTPANNFTSHDHNHHHHMQTLPKTGTGAGTCGNGNSTRRESCSGTDRRRELVVEEEFVRKRARVQGSSRSNNNHSVMESRHVGVPDHTSEMDLEVGFTSTSFGSQDYTNANTLDDSVSRSRTQREVGAEEDKKGNNEKSTVSTKRSRAAAIHNQSERKRRDKINQRMKTLQKLVPNSNKTDKASMLDEVIEYLKQLQAQVQMMSRMSMPQLMMPMAMPQHLQMAAMMAQMRMGMGMGMGMAGMDMNTVGQPNISGIPPVLNPAAAFMPISSWDGTGDRVPSSVTVLPDPMANFLATQSQPMNTDAYSRMAALYQQLHQQQVSNSKT